MNYKPSANIQYLLDFLEVTGISYSLVNEGGIYDGTAYDSSVRLDTKTAGVIGYLDFFCEFYVRDGCVVMCGVWH